MKGSFINKLRQRVSILLFLSLLITNITQPEKIMVNFDSLFPNTDYKKALDASMRLIGDIQELQQKNKEQQQQIPVDITDLFVGKLFRLKLAVDSLKEKKFDILPEDRDHLKKLIHLIDSEIRTLLFDINDGSVQLMMDLIGNIQGLLDGNELFDLF